MSWIARRLKSIDFIDGFGFRPLSGRLEPRRLRNGGDPGIPKTYVLATDPATELIGYSAHGAVARRCGK